MLRLLFCCHGQHTVSVSRGTTGLCWVCGLWQRPAYALLSGGRLGLTKGVLSIHGSLCFPYMLCLARVDTCQAHRPAGRRVDMTEGGHAWLRMPQSGAPGTVLKAAEQASSYSPAPKPKPDLKSLRAGGRADGDGGVARGRARARAGAGVPGAGPADGGAGEPRGAGRAGRRAGRRGPAVRSRLTARASRSAATEQGALQVCVQ